jgi:hypothetical protein
MFLRGKERSAILDLFRSSLSQAKDNASCEAVIMPDNHLAQPLNFMQTFGFFASNLPSSNSQFLSQSNHLRQSLSVYPWQLRYPFSAPWPAPQPIRPPQAH